MTNKAKILIFTIITVLLTIGTLLIRKYTNTLAKSNSNIIEELSEYKENARSGDIGTPPKPESSIEFNTIEGTARYEAKLIEGQKVIGNTDMITGLVWYHPETGTYYANASINASTLSTGDTNLDKELLNALKDTNVQLEVSIEGDKFYVFGQERVTDFPANLTINGVTRTKIFKVTATITEDNLIAKASTTIDINDFDIKPTTTEIDKEVVVSFDIEANNKSF